LLRDRVSGAVAIRAAVVSATGERSRGGRARSSVRCQDARMGLGRNVLFRVATSKRLERAVKSVPGGERAAWRSASRYVASRSRTGALATVEKLLERGHGVSVDLFGERVSDSAVADEVRDDYLALVAALPPPPADVWLSVDLSHLAVGAGAAAAADRLAAIADALPVGRRVQVGAEEAALTDVVQGCVFAVAASGLADRLGATVQANLVRSSADTDALADAGVHVRLVKGAYVEATGAHPYGEPTDVALLRLGFRLAGRGVAWSMATHDGRLREALLLARRSVSVEQLLGVRPEALDELHDRGVPTRVYVPYGADWFRYWMRRLAESRGA
jgi:proline dehydrogenase